MARDRLKIFELLDVIPNGMWVSDIQIASGGQNLTINCGYDYHTPRSFQMLFENCHEIHWRVTHSDSNDVNEPVTQYDVIDIFSGMDNYRESAVVATVIFELSVLYGKLTILKDW